MGDDLSNVDEVGHCSRHLAHRGPAVVVVVAEVHVVGENAETAPEEEAVDPPANSVAVLAYLA